MTLLVLMYHRARMGPHGNDPAMLDAHFAFIAEKCHCVLPGDPVSASRLNICLSFDDAYYDFYAIVFPLLKKHGLRTLLAVPPAVIAEAASSPAAERLLTLADTDCRNPHYGGFCTWPELRTLARSGLISIAAHGYTHRRLDDPGVDLVREICASKLLLSARLGCPVDSFVFPFGRFSPAALELARQTYTYAFRIGGADNASWHAGLLYRINADALPAPDALFTIRSRVVSRARRYWNLLRRR